MAEGFGTEPYGTGIWGEDTASDPLGIGVSEPSVDEFPLESLFDITNKYRYLITLCRLSGAPISYGRVDTVPGQVLLHESAANGTPNRENDYLESFPLSDISGSPSHGNEIELRPAVANNAHYTHYAIYRTKNMVAKNADFRIVENTYLYVDEVPMSKMGFALGVDIEGNLKSATVTLESATMGIEDVGSILIHDSKTKFHKIIEYIERSGNNVTFRIAQVDGSNLDDFDLDDWYYIGGDDLFIGDRTEAPNGAINYTISIFGREFTEDDVGQQMFWADGHVSFIKGFVDINTVIIEDPDDIPVDFNDYGSFVATVGITNRIYNDTVDDVTLGVYKESGDNFFFLQTRFFKPLPNGGVGALKGGAYFVSSLRNSEYFYSQLRNIYRTGSYHPDKQKNTKPIGVLTRLKDYPEALVIFGQNFTYYLDTTIEINGGNKLFGEFILVYPDPVLVDRKIGCPAIGCSAVVEGGGEIIFTNEPAIRHFNGFKYSENIAVSAVQDSFIAQIRAGTLLQWDKRRGLNIWGVNG